MQIAKKFNLTVTGEIPQYFKVAFDHFFDAINTIDRFEDSKTIKAMNEGLLQGIHINPKGTAKFFPFIKNGIVHFSSRFMYYLYTFSFSLYLLTEHVMRRELDGNWDGKPDNSNEVRWSNLYLEHARKVRDGMNSWDETLINPESKLIASKDVNVIFAMALTFIYLHEVSHLLLHHDPDMDANSMLLAEKDADLEALQVFFRDISDVSIMRNRAIAISILQASSLFSITDPKRLKSQTHPDTDVRLANIIDFIVIEDLKADYYIKTIVGIGINLFCAENRIVIDTREFETAKDHYDYLLDLIATKKDE